MIMTVYKDEYNGAEAINYAKNKLHKTKTNPDTWETEYVCKETGEIWLMDYPNSEQHGGGSPRLRKLKDWVHQ